MKNEPTTEEPKKSDLEERLTSHDEIVRFLREKRKKDFPTGAALSKHMGFPGGGTEYQKLLQFERGIFPRKEGVHNERFSAYMSAVGISDEDQAVVRGAITKTRGKGVGRIRNRRGTSFEEKYSNKAQRPSNFNPKDGQPGNWLIQRGRESFGILFGKETYEAMRNNLSAQGVLNLDEVIAYTEQLSCLYDGMNWQAKSMVDAVRNENGIERNGITFNNTIEDYARCFSKDDLQGLTFGIAISMAIPEFYYWQGKVERTTDTELIPTLEITQDKDLEATIETANARLFLYEQQGYVAARMAKRVLARAQEEYKQTQADLRDLMVEAAEFYVFHREEFDPAIVHTE